MKHWVVVALSAVMATALSVVDSVGQPDAVVTAGLPDGWLSEGLIAGMDDVGVRRPRQGGTPELVINKHNDAPAGKPLVIYQIVDAAPFRGRTVVFSSYTHVQLDPDVMRRIGDAAVAELRMECDGGQPGSKGIVLDATWSRRWVEHNPRIKVASDATRCTFGVATMVKAEVRLSRLRIKDLYEQRERFIEQSWREHPKAKAGSIFPATAAAAAPAAAPNLEFKQ